MKTRVAPSVAVETEIAELLEQGIGDSESIARLGRPGAQLVLQKGIEDVVAAFLQRVRYERTVQARGSRNGNRPKHVLTAEGELEIQMPQVAQARGFGSSGGGHPERGVGCGNGH